MPHVSLDSSFGTLTVFEDEDSLVAIGWGRTPGGEPTPLLSEAVEQLEADFDGRLRHFSLPLRPPGSGFRQRVWSRLRCISYGETETYGALARQHGPARPIRCRSSSPATGWLPPVVAWAATPAATAPTPRRLCSDWRVPPHASTPKPPCAPKPEPAQPGE